MSVETAMDALNVIHTPVNVIVTQFIKDLLGIRFELLSFGTGSHGAGTIGKDSLLCQFSSLIVPA
ncbi:TPA: hypothetical protein O9N85_004721 [Escherichia coli]|nr:hypothetical protein [Escherichia coli]